MTDHRRRLNDTQREQARRRWEGSTERGFTQLASECRHAWGVVISRQALLKIAQKGGWTKREPPSEPLAQLPTPALSPGQSRLAATPAQHAGAAPMVALNIVITVVAQGARLRACRPGK